MTEESVLALLARLLRPQSGVEVNEMISGDTALVVTINGVEFAITAEEI